MAVYNRSRVRNDSRSLKTITEASIRLDKELDPETIPLAFPHLVSLIQEYCQATVNGNLLDIYPTKTVPSQIEFNPSSPSTYAGIEIPSDFTLNCLTRLGCTINKNLITPPTLRKDILIPEDLIEEVIRFYGYNKIPTDSPIDPTPLPDITPPILYLIEKLKDNLITLGYDEVRSWPLVNNTIDPKTVVKTENSINSDYPYLRQSIIQSLQNQLDQYNRFKVPSPQFFEIGKIFSNINGQYVEKYALGIYNPNAETLHFDIDSVAPVKGRCPKDRGVESTFAEIILNNLPGPDKYIPQVINNTAIELTSQIITLDANVNFDSPQDPVKLIEKYTALIDLKILWSMEIADIYQNRYTFRVSYYNCDDKTAKKIHLSTFNLN
jgi:phenylalanyl-tRNA synthetase beta subunit